MASTLSSGKRESLAPTREVGRRRVAELLAAAEAVIQERGFEAATMSEFAERAGSNIGSLYRFFPSKDSVAEALMQHYSEVLEETFATIHAFASHATPGEVADVLIDVLVTVRLQTRSLAALLDSRSDRTEIRDRFLGQVLAGIQAALTACAPGIDRKLAEDSAVVVFNNMKTLAMMSAKESRASVGARHQLRLMNRLYLAATLKADRRSARE